MPRKIKYVTTSQRQINSNRQAAFQLAMARMDMEVDGLTPEAVDASFAFAGTERAVNKVRGQSSRAALAATAFRAVKQADAARQHTELELPDSEPSAQPHEAALGHLVGSRASTMDELPFVNTSAELVGIVHQGMRARRSMVSPSSAVAVDKALYGTWADVERSAPIPLPPAPASYHWA